ncbi:hypothetical protein [Rhodoferax sp.]|uniref:hypothetical protein n=1 Tax=Rhodoferax sp. TaxID=50421 RepID=UPI00262B0B32|nr:hypothetical protein [Rhodoferax sp.]MDD3938022.1 hypothetical protein [Rhodoferax sp.]
MSTPATTGCTHTCNQGRNCNCVSAAQLAALETRYCVHGAVALVAVIGLICLLFFLAGYLSEYLAN